MGGLGGGERRRTEQAEAQISGRSLITLWQTRETLGGITPTLTRPHQGGGNALAICEYPSPALRGEGGGEGLTAGGFRPRRSFSSVHSLDIAKHARLQLLLVEAIFHQITDTHETL